jgi:hypothetical protein
VSESWQFPSPSQVSAFTTVSPSQVPALHSVPFKNLRHPPFPSQVPSWPHVEGVLAAQNFLSAGSTPEGMNEHSPSDEGRLQALHPSVQAEEQQMPLTQKPD